MCGSRVNNTSDKGFLLFTRDAGMLWASAKSVREEKSRQRFALQDFSLVRLSLIKGKSGWRIGSAECVKNYFSEEGVSDPVGNRSARARIVAVVKLLRQFLHGEIAYFQIFEDTKKALDLNKSLDDTNNKKILDIFTLRFLHQLGYIAADKSFSEYLSSEKWDELPSLPEKAHNMVERAKQASHL